MRRDKDLRLLSDDGDLVVVTITESTSAGGQIPERLIDAIDAEFSDDDSVSVKRSGD